MTAAPLTCSARIQAAFDRARSEGRAAFIPYMTAGFPDRARYLDVATALLEHADLLEVGLPYSDPLGDGPTIQRASEAALRGGVSAYETFALAAELRARTDKPLLLMTYINPVYALGPRRFLERAVQAGFDGLILPDLPPDQDDEIAALATELGLALTFLIAPTSTPERVQLVARACTGFVYAVSVVGITGAREGSALHEVPRLVDLARRFTDKPIAVGFGVRDGATAHEVAEVADGVVVGSVFVNAAEQGQDVGALAAEIRAGTRR